MIDDVETPQLPRGAQGFAIVRARDPWESKHHHMYMWMNNMDQNSLILSNWPFILLLFLKAYFLFSFERGRERERERETLM